MMVNEVVGVHKLVSKVKWCFFFSKLVGPNQSQLVGTGSSPGPVRTGLRTAEDRVRPVRPSPVLGPRILEKIRTGSVRGSGPNGSRTGTGPDLKALVMT
jgi:hypothetical protein